MSTRFRSYDSALDAPVNAKPLSAYERVGPAGVKAVVESFYSQVLRHPELAPYFAHLDADNLARVKRHQALLIGQVLGGPSKFDAGTLGDVHQPLRIEPRHYRLTAHLLVGTMWRHDVPADSIFEVSELLASLESVLAPVDSRADAKA